MISADAAMTFLDFVVERHRVWELRQAGAPQPWTDDPVLRTRKFTNVFRVLDFGSQFILTDLVDTELAEEDLLMRLFLYRHTGRVEVWKHVLGDLGEYPTRENLWDVLESMKDYRGEAHVRTRTADPKNAGRKTQTDFKRSVFTSAYLVFPQSAVKGTDKLESIFDLTHRLFVSGGRVAHDFLSASSQADRFAALRTNKGVADFMSMQILTDWGYTPHCGEDREDLFVVPGPGAVKGAAALDPKARASAVLEWAFEAVQSLPECPVIEPHDGVLRKPSKMDVQNCLCEFSKYVRFASRPSPERQYSPAHPGVQLSPVLPQHWH